MVKVHEVIETKEGSIVDESKDQTCKDEDNNTKWSGSSWLSKDSCNICYCPVTLVTKTDQKWPFEPNG